jgi:hypothetical protein
MWVPARIAAYCHREPRRPEQLDVISSAAAKIGRGLPVWVIAEDLELTAPLLGTVIEAAKGRSVRGDPALLECSVRDTVIVAMSLDAAALVAAVTSTRPSALTPITGKHPRPAFEIIKTAPGPRRSRAHLR